MIVADRDCPEGADVGNTVNQMKMPSSYVDMNLEEIQYDGGFDWTKALYITAAVGAAIAVSGFGVGAVAAYWGGSLASGTELAFARTLSGVAIKMILGGGFLGMTTVGGAIISQGPGNSD